MTREEAIRIIREIQFPVNGDNKAERDSAIETAIKALEQEPCDKYIKEIDHLRKYISKLETQIVEQEPKSPCDLCRFNPPSSADGKPCTMCTAERSEE